MAENRKEILYKEFLKNFPNFKSMVRSYYLTDENTLKIYTKQKKKFYFTITENGFDLSS